MIVKYTILIIYFGILFLLGILASRRIEGMEDFFVGGKKLGFWVVAFSARATGESAWLLLGLTGMGAILGVQAFWVVLGELTGVTVAWFLMAKPFKNQSDQFNSITIPDYLVSRFNASSHLLRSIAATALSVFVVIYVSAQIDATGSAFETFLGWNYYTGALVGFGIVVAYIFFGGFVAVAWSDLFQGLIMGFGLLFLPIAAYLSIDNPGEITAGLREIDPSLLNIWGKGGFSGANLLTILGLSLIGIGFMGAPQVFVRFMSIKDQGEIKKGRWVAFVFTLLTDTSAVLIGLLGRYILTDAGEDAIALLGNGAQNVLPMLVDKIMPLTIIGIFIAAVLAAIMSTIDSLLVVASSAITRDFYQQIFKPDLKQETMASLSRNITVLLAIVALGIAMAVAVLSPTRTIFWFVIFGWSGLAATFCPVMILALAWPAYNEKGAIASMVTGFLSVPFFKFLAPGLPVVGDIFTNLGELPPSFALAMLVGTVVSLVTSKTE